MTAPNGPILFNSSTGSDTAASGLGPDPAQTGTGASTTAASAVVTGITTTGVNSGDLLWVQSSSGRQFSIIASVDSGTQVTCDDTFANTESGRNWAIGGKRETLFGSSQLFDADPPDWKPGWILELADGHTESTSGQFLLRTNTNDFSTTYKIRGEAGATTKPRLTYTGSNIFLQPFGNGGDATIALSDLELFTTVGGGTEGLWGQGFTRLENVVIDGFGIGWDQKSHPLVAINTEVRNCTTYGLRVDTFGATLEKCNIHSNSGDGLILTANDQNGPIRVARSIIANNGGDGLQINTTGTRNRTIGFDIVQCIIHGNTGDGVECSSGDDDVQALFGGRFIGNIITENGGYGINFSTITSLDNVKALGMNLDHNAFYSNTSGHRNGVGASDNDVELTADPFVDAAASDFNINNDPGGGALLRAATVALP